MISVHLFLLFLLPFFLSFLVTCQELSENQNEQSTIKPANPSILEVAPLLQHFRQKITKKSGIGLTNPLGDVKNRSPLIWNGQLAPPGAYPWNVAIGIRPEAVIPDPSLWDEYPVSQFVTCTASLINEWFVITAAHCLNDHSAHSFRAFINYTDLNMKNSELDPNHDFFGVEWFTIHQGYRDDGRINDLALVKLDRPATGIPPVVLGDHSNIPPVGSMVKVLGWGEIETGGLPPNLRETDIMLENRSICEQYLSPNYWKGYHGMSLTADIPICLWNEGGNSTASYGDSGGPAVIWDEELQAWVQLGITSHKPVEISTDPLSVPTYFVSIPDYRTWILERANLSVYFAPRSSPHWPNTSLPVYIEGEETSAEAQRFVRIWMENGKVREERQTGAATRIVVWNGTQAVARKWHVKSGDKIKNCGNIKDWKFQIQRRSIVLDEFHWNGQAFLSDSLLVDEWVNLHSNKTVWWNSAENRIESYTNAKPVSVEGIENYWIRVKSIQVLDKPLPEKVFWLPTCISEKECPECLQWDKV